MLAGPGTNSQKHTPVCWNCIVLRVKRKLRKWIQIICQGNQSINQLLSLRLIQKFGFWILVAKYQSRPPKITFALKTLISFYTQGRTREGHWVHPPPLGARMIWFYIGIWKKNLILEEVFFTFFTIFYTTILHVKPWNLYGAPIKHNLILWKKAFLVIW